jgi:hypothetical protein
MAEWEYGEKEQESWVASSSEMNISKFSMAWHSNWRTAFCGWSSLWNTNGTPASGAKRKLSAKPNTIYTIDDSDASRSPTLHHSVTPPGHCPENSA